jgi:hypothetical protein
MYTHTAQASPVPKQTLRDSLKTFQPQLLKGQAAGLYRLAMKRPAGKLSVDERSFSLFGQERVLEGVLVDSIGF